MLRNAIITIGFLIAINPYLGFPDAVDSLILTTLGLTIVFLIAFSRKGKHYRAEIVAEETAEQPKILHVERTEVEDTPQVHIERVITVDKELVHDLSGGEDTEVEKKTTVVRRRKQKHAQDVLRPSAPDENA